MQVGVTGTPAIIFDDGSMIPGYQDPAQLLAELSNK
jgi:protein-disulfide isomerase